jgi:hypothetical protein
MTTKEEEDSKYCLAFPKPHPDQIPITKYGNHEYKDVVFDPKINRIVHKGRMVEWRRTKTHLKNKDPSKEPKQYEYESLVIPDAEGKKRKIFRKKFELFIEENHKPKVQVKDEFDMKLLDNPDSILKRPVPLKKVKVEEPSSPKILQTQPNLPQPIECRISFVRTVIEQERDPHPSIYEYFVKNRNVVWEVEDDDDGLEDPYEEEKLYYY